MSHANRSIETRFPASSELLRFLKENLQLVLLWPLVALIIGVAGWASFFSRQDSEAQRAEAEALRRVAALSSNYAERINRAANTFDRLLLHVRYDWQLSHGLTRLERSSEAGLFSPDAVAVVSMFDENGLVLTSSIPSQPDTDVLDRAYFSFHKKADDDRLFIDKPTVGRISHRTVIHFSRRLPGPDGRFGGVVVVSVIPEFFTANYAEATLGQKGLLGVQRNDGVILVTRLGMETRPSAPHVLQRPPNANGASGTGLLKGSEWFADKRDRYVGWQQVKGYPLVAVVGLDRQEALADYQANRSTAFEHAVWNTIGLGLFALLAMAFSLMLAWRKYQLESERAAYRRATEEGNDGFYINRPVRNKRREIIDFLVVDSNQRGAELFNLSRNELVGKRLSEIWQGEILQRVLERLRNAMEHGIYETEIQASASGRLQVDWVNFKAVRCGNHLSVTIRDISESKSHLQELERRVNEDALTKLPNRYWIQRYLPQAIERARARGTRLALLFVDIDGFKAVNDALGHAVGDSLLRTVAKRLKAIVRPEDHVVRLGSDEFVVIVEGPASNSEIREVAERIRDSFQSGFDLSQGLHSLRASIGISLYPDDGEDAETLLKNADIAMYWAKTSDKGSYRFFEPHFYEVSRARLENEIELRRAIELDQFVMHYQPRINIADGTIRSMEALVRWMHPARGLVQPLEFIPLAEDTGLILQLGELVIDKVCADLAQWTKTGQKLVPVSVNVSPRQFNESDMPAVFSGAISRHGISGELLEIEVTESSMMRKQDDVSSSLRRLREMGIKLCIDDFGTGYSSLSQLQRLEFDVLKVDRAFTIEIEKPEGEALFVAIITMAHALGMQVVAEGVENRRQLHILKLLHCDEVQGYYVSKPIPTADAQPASSEAFLPAMAIE